MEYFAGLRTSQSHPYIYANPLVEDLGLNKLIFVESAVVTIEVKSTLDEKDPRH
jgi:hypothetical protein